MADLALRFLFVPLLLVSLSSGCVMPTSDGRRGSTEPLAQTGDRCVIISEYIEGDGHRNKAIEIFNCGDAPVALTRVGICLVRNDDATCSRFAMLAEPGSAAQLDPGATRVLCPSRRGRYGDPERGLAHACDIEIGAVGTFNGDDRLALFEDADGDGVRSGEDPLLDVFGDLGKRPVATPWARVDHRRCSLEPHRAGPFRVEDHYTAHAVGWSHLGVPPDDSCGVSDEGERCTEEDTCAAGLRCIGRPRDGSSEYGRCVDISRQPGEGTSCSATRPCGEGLVCAGGKLFGEGTCNPAWMAGTFATDAAVVIPDGPHGEASSSVIAEGLASVPVDLEVVISLDHPRPSDLVVTLYDPNGTSAVLWDRTDALFDGARSDVRTGISRDDEVNGRWQLVVEDRVAGAEGTLEGFTLSIISRWD